MTRGRVKCSMPLHIWSRASRRATDVCGLRSASSAFWNATRSLGSWNTRSPRGPGGSQPLQLFDAKHTSSLLCSTSVCMARLGRRLRHFVALASIIWIASVIGAGAAGARALGPTQRISPCEERTLYLERTGPPSQVPTRPSSIVLWPLRLLIPLATGTPLATIYLEPRRLCGNTATPTTVNTSYIIHSTAKDSAETRSVDLSGRFECHLARFVRFTTDGSHSRSVIYIYIYVFACVFFRRSVSSRCLGFNVCNNRFTRPYVKDSV